MQNRRETRVFFFGDSICSGQGVSIHKGWVTRTSQALSRLARGGQHDVTVINVSISGNTTRQALERMPYDIQSQRPDLLIVQFGMNDCNHWETDRGVPRVSSKAFAANLEEIIVRALTFGAEKAILNTNHPTARDEKALPFTSISYQESNELYNRVIREVGEKLGPRVILKDVEEAFKRYTGSSRERLLELLLPDLLHLSERGHDLYFRTVYPAIETVVLELLEKREG